MNYTIDDFDDDDYRKAADEALTRPSDASFCDDRLYTTHAPVLSWADRGDDLIAESNFHTVLAHLTEIAAQHGEEDAVFDGSVSHWLVGSLRQVYVQVYYEDGDFTRTFKEAVVTAHFLRDEYPIFDETDFNEREWDRNEALFDETLSEVADRHEYDSEFDRDSITERLHETRNGYYNVPPNFLANYPDVTFDEVAEAWDEVREAYFTKRALEEGFAPLDGQLSII
jgi:hypothetical protein